MSRKLVVGILVGVGVAAGIAAGASYALIDSYGGQVGYVSLDGSGAVAPVVNVNNPSNLGYGSFGIGIGDFDKDGVDDYVNGGYQSGSLAHIDFHKGLGGSSYAPPQPIVATGNSFYDVMDFAVADYDGDGNLDFAVNDYDQQQVRTYRGHGDGTFDLMNATTIGFYAIGLDSADLNGDGIPDIVAVHYWDVNDYYNSTRCSIVWTDYYYGRYISSYSCPNDQTTVAVLLGDGHGGFTQSQQTMTFGYTSTPPGYNYPWIWGITAADFDGDGKADIAVNEPFPSGQSNNELLVFHGNGDGTFQNEPRRTAASFGESYQYASLDNDDVNGDGIQDILFGSESDESFRVYLGNGDGTFRLGSFEYASFWFTGISSRSNGAIDRTPPSVALQPLPALTNQPSVTVQGTATDAGGVAEIDVLDGATVIATATPGAGGAVSATVTLADGSHAIALRAKDRAGNIATTAAEAVNVDTHPPAVGMNPLPQYATDASFAVSGTAIDDNSGIAVVSVTVNGTGFAGTIDPSGAVVANVMLVPGSNTISLTATDVAGNTAPLVSGTVIYDDVGPSVALNALPDFTNVAAQVVTGTVTDRYGVQSLQLVVAGAAVGAPFLPAADGTFSAPVLLAEGANAISVVATNVAGLTGHAQLATTLDTVPPTATLGALPQYTNNPTLAVTGTAADDRSGVASATFSVRSVSASSPVAGDGSVAASLPLTEGEQTITLEVRDRAGNVGSTVATVTLDTVPPTIAIVVPDDGQPFGATTVGVTTSVSDSSPVTVSFGTYAFALAAGGGISSGTVELPGEGWATIPITARDAAGNASSASVKVMIDLTAPVADVDVADGLQLGPQPGNQLPFDLHVDDLTQVTTGESWDASFASTFAPGGGVLTGLFPLAEGHDTFAFTLTDAVGHVTVVSRTLTYDVTPPAAAFAGVLATPGTAVRGSIELAATATDNLTGVAAAQIQVDGTPVPTSGAGGAFTATFDTTTVADGTHTVTATFRDGVGNASTLTGTVVIDNTPPTVAITSPAAGSYLRQTISITAAASDATSGVAEIDLAVNGAPAGSCSTSPCTVSFDTTALANGPFVVTARARDGAGNSAAAPQLTAIADNSAPAKFLISPVTGSTAGASVSLQVNVTDDYFAQVECFEDGVSLGVSTSPQLTKTISLLDKLDGPVVFSCTARDLAGNAGTESATVTVKNWLLQVQPRTLNLRSNGNDVQLEIDGPNVSLLLPVTGKGLALAVSGGSPVPVAAKPGGYQLGTVTIGGVTEQSLALKFDRAALSAAIKAGLASGAIADPSALVVRFLAGSRELGRDTIRVQP